MIARMLMAMCGGRSGFGPLGAALSACLCLGAAGCTGLLAQSPVAKAYFAIDPGRPETQKTAAATTLPNAPVLRVRTLRVSPPYDGVAFVYRIGPSQLDTDYYNNFVAPPASLLTGSLIQWLSRSVPMTVCDGSSDLRSDLILEGNIIRLYIDSTTTPSPTAMIAARFFVTRDPHGAVELVSERTYEDSAPVTTRSPAGFVSAWGQAYRKLLIQLTADLMKSSQGDPKAPTDPPPRFDRSLNQRSPDDRHVTDLPDRPR